MPKFVSDGSDVCNEPQDKAEVFNKYFHSVFLEKNDAQMPAMNHYHNGALCDFTFTQEQVLAILRNLDANKASGPDGLSPYVLKHCCHQLAASLTILFNKSLQAGKVPAQWKLANVTPIFKNGDKHTVNN